MAKVGTRKRGTSWQYYFEGAKIDGKRKQVVKSGFATKKEAYEAGVKALAKYSEGDAFTASNISVNDYMDEWTRLHLEVNLTPGTQRNYTKIVDSIIRPRFGKMYLRSLNPTMLQEMLNDAIYAILRDVSRRTLTCGIESQRCHRCQTDVKRQKKSPRTIRPRG